MVAEVLLILSLNVGEKKNQNMREWIFVEQEFMKNYINKEKLVRGRK